MYDVVFSVHPEGRLGHLFVYKAGYCVGQTVCAADQVVSEARRLAKEARR